MEFSLYHRQRRSQNNSTTISLRYRKLIHVSVDDIRITDTYSSQQGDVEQQTGTYGKFGGAIDLKMGFGMTNVAIIETWALTNSNNVDILFVI